MGVRSEVTGILTAVYLARDNTSVGLPLHFKENLWKILRFMKRL